MTERKKRVTVTAEALAYAFEWVRDPDEPRRTVIPTGYSTMLASEVKPVRLRQAELVLHFLEVSGVARQMIEDGDD